MKITVTGSRRAIRADQYDDVWQSIAEINQEFTSENTSMNKGKKPAVFGYPFFKSALKPGTINIDYGGGRFDNVAEYLMEYDVINLVLDPFNRSSEHNKEVIETLRAAGGADTGTCANVLNVIKEQSNRMQVLKNLKALVKPGGKIYIIVYEDTKNAHLGEGETTNGYQLRRKTKDYMGEILSVFPNAQLMNEKGRVSKAGANGKLIYIVNQGGGTATASRKMPDGLITL